MWFIAVDQSQIFYHVHHQPKDFQLPLHLTKCVWHHTNHQYWGSKTCADVSTPSPNDTLSSPPMVCATSEPFVPSRPKKRRLAAPVQEEAVELAIASQLGKIGEVLSQRTTSNQTTWQPDECNNFEQMIACQYRHLNSDHRPIFMQGIQIAYLEALTYQAPATDWRF